VENLPDGKIGFNCHNQNNEKKQNKEELKELFVFFVHRHLHKQHQP